MVNCTDPLPFGYHGAAAISSSTLIGLLGFAAVFLLLWRHKGFSKSVDNILLSFGAGAMLGEALFHIVPLVVFPEPEENHNSAEWLALWLLLTLMAGFTVFFIIEVSLPHEHDLQVAAQQNTYSDIPAGEDGEAHENQSLLHHESPKQSSVDWKRVLMVLSIDAMHNFLDAVALGAAWRYWQDGLSLFLAIFLHEIGHEMANFVFLVTICRMGEKRALIWNGMTAMLSNLGAIIGWLLAARTSSADAKSAGGSTDWILAFAGGGFLYMSNAQIIPVLLQTTHSNSDSTRTHIINTLIILIPFTLGLLLIFGLVVSQKGGLMEWCR